MFLLFKGQLKGLYKPILHEKLLSLCLYMKRFPVL